MFAFEIKIMAGSTEKNEMSFLDHLEELRWHLVRSALAIALVGILAFVFKAFVFDIVILGPSSASFPTNRWLCLFGQSSFLHTDVLCINRKEIALQNIQMAGQFMAHIKISLMAGLVVGFPYIFYEIWRFVKPALYSKERNIAHGAVLAISLLFFLGVAFGYYLCYCCCNN